MPTFLAGGTGTPKLLWGTDAVFDPATVTVVGNTGDDVELGGLFVCPDIDTVLYERSDELDRETWWGRAGDPANTHEEIRNLAEGMDRGNDPRFLAEDRQTAGRDLARWRRFSAVPEFMRIGDLDRAVHLARTSLLDEGDSLTTVTRKLATAFGLTIELIPMSDDPVSSIIHTPSGEMHFQEYWVARGGDPQVTAVEFRGSEQAKASEAALDALDEPVIIGPSNPVTSIGPMSALDDFAAALRDTTVVAVSPFVEDRVFSGPAAELMAAEGYEPSTAGVAAAYPFADAFVLDSADDTSLDRPVVRTDSHIETASDATRVAEAAKRAIEVA